MDKDPDATLLKSMLESIRARLLDQSRRNRLINYNESARDIAIINEMSDQVFCHLVTENKHFVFDPQPDGEDTQIGLLESDKQSQRKLPASVNQEVTIERRYTDNRLQTPYNDKDLERRLRKLYTEHRTIIEETGANSLHLAIGYLRWHESNEDATPFLSPLILLPVRLERERGFGTTIYRLVFGDEALDTNYSLYQRLKHDFDITLPLLTDEPTPEEYLRQVEKAITRFTRDGWEVVREMSLGLFRFYKQVMWNDLDSSHWPQNLLLKNPTLQRVLLGARSDEQPPGQLTHYYDEDAPNKAGDLPPLILLRDTDSSQYAALIDAIKTTDRSGLVIEGPPGTGKSQTITNLIGVALEKGLSILFVAEKMAALEVVYRRLEEAHLGAFCLQLHGLKTNKKELLNEVAYRVNLKMSPPAQIEVHKRDLQHTKKELIELSTALSQLVGPEQIPMHNLIWRVERLRQELPQDFKAVETRDAEGLDFESFTTLKNLFTDLGKEWIAIPATARQCWRGFTPTNYEENQQPAIQTLIEQGQNAVRTISEWLNAKQLPETVPSLCEVSRLIKLGALNTEAAIPPLPVEADLDLAYTVIQSNILQAFKELLDQVIEYQHGVADVNRVFDYHSEHSSSYSEQLNEHVKKMAGTICQPETAISDLPNEKQLAERIIRDLESLPKLAKPITTATKRNCRTLDDYEELIDQAKELTTGPIELVLHANPFHSKAVCSTYLQNAKKQYFSLRQEGESRLQLFRIGDVTDAKALRQAYNDILACRNRRFVLLRPSYRRARKYIRNLMVDRRVFSQRPEFIRTLELLVLHCERQQEFAENRDFQTALGNLFEGIKTDWEKLESLVNFSRGLSNRVGPDIAQKILSDWGNHVETMEGISHQMKHIIELIRGYASIHHLPQTIWQRPTEHITDALRSSSATIKAAIDSLLKKWCNSNTTLGQAIRSVDNYHLAKTKEESIERHAEFKRVLGSHWNKSITRIHPLESTYHWINDRLKIEGITLELLRRVLPAPGVFSTEEFAELVAQAKSLSNGLSDQYDVLNRYGEVNEVEWYGGRNATLSDFELKLSNCAEALSSLPLLHRWRTIYQQVCDLGYNELAGLVSSGDIAGNQCESAFEFSIYEKLLKKRISSEPRLARFGKVSYENLRERFSKLDQEILKSNAQIIAARLCERDVPEGAGYGPVKNYTQKRLLLHEAGKKRNHLPIRQLIHRASEALVGLKPCFLMSPLSVAQYLVPGRVKFDLVVMDEASQLRPEDALGTIARGSKAVIVGDPKQLPPTTFFDTAVAEEEDTDETVVTDTESILDVCLKQFPFRRLRWHYRSRHEALIQFSNQQFYENDLIVFPSPKGGSREYGVHYTFVDKPSYRNGRNRGEAEVVVDNIIHHFARHSKKSLGVAAFNRRQADEIELLLERRRSADPSIDDVIAQHEAGEPLFIKNLENVQGDERDVIFISTTYGPEKLGGPVFQRFGPVNSDVGWRRLNVIATRARERVEVFSSLRPTDIRVGENTRRGVRALRDYLEYASTGRVTEHGTPTGKGPESEFEEAVSNLLQNLGYETDPQVGVAGFYIDVGVRHPDRAGEYLMGIECDGATYHSARSVRDRDRLRQEILEDKGWYIHRIWSTSWYHTRSAEIETLKRVLATRLEADRQSYTAWAEQHPEPEVVSEVQHASAEEMGREQKEERESLEDALRRFRAKNIESHFPNTDAGILSEKMIESLVSHRPRTERQWFASVPIELRQSMDARQRGFLSDILDLIAEYE